MPQAVFNKLIHEKKNILSSNISSRKDINKISRIGIKIL